MISCRSQRFLLTSLSRFQNVRLNLLWQRSFSNRSQRVTQTSRIPKYLALLGFGGASFYLYDRFRNSSEVVDTQLGHTEASVNLDLNEIYEKTAVVFLSNAEVREILGMPIKITSNNSISDTVRSIDLRREGSDLYAFIAYFVQGSQNSGVVYCKLKMNQSNEKFRSESILLKLNKPDPKKRTEIVIKVTQNVVDQKASDKSDN